MLFLILSVMATWTPAVGTLAYYSKQWMNFQQAQEERRKFLQWGSSSQSNINSTPPTTTSVNVSPVVTAIWDSTWVEWFSDKLESWSSRRSVTPPVWDGSYSQWSKSVSANISSSINKDGTAKTQVAGAEDLSNLKWPLTSMEEEDKKKQNQLIDLSTKQGTYAWFMKQPWYTPESARKAAIAYNQKLNQKKETTGKTTPIDTSMNVETPVNESNIYDKGREVYKDVNKEKEAAEGAIKTSSTSTAWSIKSEEIDAYDNMEKSITSERDAFVSKLEELQTWFEWTRLWQVRGQIIQWLASRWVNISQLTPEQIVQLSWDVGSKAFADIHAQKVDTENKIKSAKDLATSKLNELLAKKAISETNYLENINTINNTYTKNIADLNASYAQSILGIDEKQVAEMKSKTTTALNILAQIGIPTDQQHLFAGIVAGSKTPEEVMRKIAMTKLTPEQQAAYDKWVEQRNATAKSEAALKQYQIDTEAAIAREKIAAEKQMSAEQLANSTLGRGLQLAENYTNMAKAAKDVWDLDTSKRYLEAASKIMNSIWTSWGGASTTSP